jgi:hypothetical protein
VSIHVILNVAMSPALGTSHGANWCRQKDSVAWYEQIEDRTCLLNDMSLDTSRDTLDI